MPPHWMLSWLRSWLLSFSLLQNLSPPLVFIYFRKPQVYIRMRWKWNIICRKPICNLDDFNLQWQTICFSFHHANAHPSNFAIHSLCQCCRLLQRLRLLHSHCFRGWFLWAQPSATRTTKPRRYPVIPHDDGLGCWELLYRFPIPPRHLMSDRT